MSKVYITITGTKYFYGKEFLEPKMEVVLKKEPDNEHDAEAIRVEYPGLSKIGYVANSAKSVIGESYRAGRLYDRIGKKAKAKVLIVLDNAVICKVSKKSLK